MPIDLTGKPAPLGPSETETVHAPAHAKTVVSGLSGPS